MNTPQELASTSRTRNTVEIFRLPERRKHRPIWGTGTEEIRNTNDEPLVMQLTFISRTLMFVARIVKTLVLVLLLTNSAQTAVRVRK